MAYIYILQSEVNGRYYIGSTSDIDRRIEEHNSGKTRSTRLTKPFKIVFTKIFETIEEARKVELQLKNKKSRKIIELIISTGVITFI